MPPLVIAHRGASGYRPEHTLEGYELAVELGADFIEPDLVSTSDGVLVARHENEISGTTDVGQRPEFADRRTTKLIDGAERDGWFAEDFTLAELQTLRARERLPELRGTEYDGRSSIPTFEEVLELAGRLNVGVYPETKHPTYHQGIGLALEEPLLQALESGPDVPVFIQSFESGNLRALRGRTDHPLVQLIGPSTAPALHEIARYADAVGPAKSHIVPRDEQGRSLEPTSFVDDAHAAGLQVHPYTFRSENAFLPLELRDGDDPAAHGNARAEYEQFYALGVDAVFSDFSDAASQARSSASRMSSGG